MIREGKTVILAGILLISFGLITARLSAQSPEEMRRAFVDLHDDKVPHNCERAIDWLFKYRDQLKDDLVDELYKTDLQGRYAIFHILVNTPSFVPDERFLRFFATTLPETETGDEDWQFINDHFDQFDPLLKEQVSKMGSRPHEMYSVWATVWLAKKRKILDQYAPLFTPGVLAEVAKNLKDDQIGYNASQAIRLFLLLGDQSLPTLREATKSSEKQTASLARATIDALAGKREAFGYLCAKLSLTSTPFGPKVEEPAWLPDLVVRYLERENYP